MSGSVRDPAGSQLYIAQQSPIKAEAMNERLQSRLVMDSSRASLWRGVGDRNARVPA
jgi:hypothetical protein